MASLWYNLLTLLAIMRYRPHTHTKLESSVGTRRDKKITSYLPIRLFYFHEPPRATPNHIALFHEPPRATPSLHAASLSKDGQRLRTRAQITALNYCWRGPHGILPLSLWQQQQPTASKLSPCCRDSWHTAGQITHSKACVMTGAMSLWPPLRSMCGAC